MPALTPRQGGTVRPLVQFLRAAALTAALLPSPALAEVAYDLRIQLIHENRLLKAEAAITYPNESTQELKELMFRLDANTQAKLQVQEVVNADGLVLPSRPYRYTYLDREIEDPLLYQVFLPTPLKPGEKIKLTFRYTISRLPQVGNNYYLIDDPHRRGLGSWYPRAIPFLDGQWKPERMVNGNYTVSAKVSENQFIITPIAPVSISSADRNYRYSAERIPGLDLVITPNFLLRSAEVDDLQLRYYYPGDMQKWSPEVIESATNILQFYKQRYGVLPAKRLTIVAVENAAYPVLASNQLIILPNRFSQSKNETLNHQRLTELLAYGIAQQYWGQRVMEEGIYPPWVTQGLALYLTHSYLQRRRQPFELGDAFTERYLLAARQGWSTALNTPRLLLERQPYDHFAALAQGKGYTVFRLLDTLLGRQALEKAEKSLQRAHLQRPITAAAVQKEMELVSGKELDWFFQQWVRDGAVLDYGIQSLAVNKTAKGFQATVGLQRLGEAIMPVTVALVLRNGETVFKLWDGAQTSDRLVIDVPADVKEVKLDPAKASPDIDRTNNFFSNGH
jgi:hypothetical protein